MKADLHLHTTASDGRLNPCELVELAADVGLDVIAITDHDTVDGIAPAITAAEAFSSLKVVPGIEMSTDVPHGEVHILGYFIDYKDENFVFLLKEMNDSRWGCARKMVVKLNNLGIDIKWTRVCELAQGGTVCRPHVAQAILENGYVESIREAFDKYIGREGPAYVQRKKILPIEAVRTIVKARGLPVLAHPADIGDLERLICELKEAGLVGIEVYYGAYTSDVIKRLQKLAIRYELIATGGTDYHAFGNDLEVMIGRALTPSHSVEQLFSLAYERDLIKT